jgi:putative heme-binding domain-containing protein
LGETNILSASTALLALARLGPPEVRRPIIEAVLRLAATPLSDAQQLGLWRVLELALLRSGSVDEPLRSQVTARLDPLYPAPTWAVNRELSRLLIYLGAPDVVPKTLDLLSAAPSQEQQFHYVAQLRSLREGWTMPDRRRFLEWWVKPRQQLPRPPELSEWFAQVGRQYVDGAWVDRYLREFRADAVSTLDANERKQLADLLAKPFQRALLTPAQPRAFVREWTMADLMPELDQLGKGRNFERGRQAFADVQCITCHRLGNDGGAVGPELTGAGSKYDARSLLESILEPSKVVSEQYQNLTVRLKSGDSFTGRILRETAEKIVLETDPVNSVRETIERRDVEGISPSLLSPMPEGLANSLSREEILDLLAYVKSGARLPVTEEAAVKQ